MADPEGPCPQCGHFDTLTTNPDTGVLYCVRSVCSFVEGSWPLPGMGVKVNQRMFMIQQAENEIHRFILDKMQEHDLTYIEELQILNQISASALKYALRIERHGDASKEADLDHDDHDDEPNERASD